LKQHQNLNSQVPLTGSADALVFTAVCPHCSLPGVGWVVGASSLKRAPHLRLFARFSTLCGSHTTFHYEKGSGFFKGMRGKGVVEGAQGDGARC